MQPVFAILSLTLLIVHVSCSILAPVFTRQSSADGLGLGSIPDACQSTCGPIESTINTCQELSCLCNNDVAKQIAVCANCLVGVAGDSASSLQTQEQSVIDQYTNACSTSGEPVSSIQVSSVAPSGSGTVSGSSTVSSSSGTSTITSAASASTSSSSSSGVGTIVDANSGICATVFAGLIALLVSV